MWQNTDLGDNLSIVDKRNFILLENLHTVMLSACANYHRQIMCDQDVCFHINYSVSGFTTMNTRLSDMDHLCDVQCISACFLWQTMAASASSCLIITESRRQCKSVTEILICLLFVLFLFLSYSLRGIFSILLP